MNAFFIDVLVVNMSDIQTNVANDVNTEGAGTGLIIHSFCQIDHTPDSLPMYSDECQ